MRVREGEENKNRAGAGSVTRTTMGVCFFFLLLSLSACGDDNKSPTAPTPIPSTPQRTIADITCQLSAVVDGVLTLNVGDTATASCQVEYSNNTTAALPVDATWDSEDTSIATVTPGGEITGVAPGDTHIVVTLNTATATHTARFAVHVETPFDQLTSFSNSGRQFYEVGSGDQQLLHGRYRIRLSSSSSSPVCYWELRENRNVSSAFEGGVVVENDQDEINVSQRARFLLSRDCAGERLP